MTENTTSNATDLPKKEGMQDFIRERIKTDIAANKNEGRVMTRFPPEPNGYLHIGHAKSITLNFGVAAEFNGVCNLRFDDTNPLKESQEYVNSIQEDIRWLGMDWEDRYYFASDYFDQMYAYAVQLIERGKAYVCSLTPEQIKEYRGTPSNPGTESPDRNRPIQENLDLFERMRKGEFADGTYLLRAKIDMASPNMHMRDPVIYRIRKAYHHRTGDRWCIYPMYDFAHCLSDSIEGVTHSLCTLEFEVHRPLYDWILDALEVYHPQQIEFARLNMTHTVLSKRKLLSLVDEGYVSGWDDPRMPTIAGMRRRGYTPEAIRNFCERIGVAKRDNLIDLALLEYYIRQDLEEKAPRVMGVLKPLRVVIENYPEEQVEEFDCPYHPTNPAMGSRTVPFSKVIYIERDDFMEDPPKKFFRLSPGREVRLRYAYLITCTDVIKDNSGSIIELRCTYDPETKGGSTPDGRKVKGTLHWVSDSHALDAEVRLYSHLFTEEVPGGIEGERDFREDIDPSSLEVLQAKVEPSLKSGDITVRYQFERLGYFCKDPVDSQSERLVFNRTVTLRDTWAKIQNKQS
jgi:glutaminyl-tRNA synthetase